MGGSRRLLSDPLPLRQRVLGGSMYEDGMFKTIRSHDNIGHINFKNPSLYDLSKEEKSKAKSGSIFVSSKDDRFFIKSNNKADFNALKSCLPALATHLISGKENLTLPLYGCFESPNKKETFLLMKKLKADITGPSPKLTSKGPSATVSERIG